jgi:hypothetical protein
VVELWSNGFLPTSTPILQNSSTPAFFVMALTNLHLISATEAARLVCDGVISSAQLVEACLPLGSF